MRYLTAKGSITAPQCSGEFLRPGKLWSAWDMVANFRFSAVHLVLFHLDVLISQSSKNMEAVERIGGYSNRQVMDEVGHDEIMADSVNAVESVSDLAAKLFAPLKCAHIDEALKSLQYWLKHTPPKWSELNTRSRALRDAIKTELEGHLFYRYPKPKGEKFSAWMTDWKASLVAFPDIKTDVFCAVDCYALNHSTASVFHSMRVAEVGLRALAKERKARLAKNRPLEWANWQEIITAIDGAIKVIGNKRAGPAKDSALEFYSGARADLNGFKDEYRNLVMHARASYDEFQALRALTNVHAFMERLSAKIDHRHQCIKWGRF